MRYAVVSATQWHSKLINHPTTLEDVLGYHQALKILRTFSPDEKKLSTDFFPVITPNNKNNKEYPLILFFHMKGLKPPSLDGDFDFNSLTYARLRGAWFDDFQSSAPKCANPPTSVGGS
ncbi:hypothetical protein XBFM1_2250001 [Xenorhabdus bovienii str. feltiae Moldova]|nr:hypothetical protein XBFM1_2250001 [Xenorhabdus bovienii str. feltiae Moldova]